MKTTASIEQLNKALKAINKQYKGNIIYNREPEQISKNRVSFTLKVKDSNKTGARRGHTGRKMISACWHVHGDLFDALFKIKPDVLILAGTQRITAEHGNWIDRNIGSIMSPLYYSEACIC